jgi:hypothetical protein
LLHLIENQIYGGARLMTTGRDTPSKADSVTIAAIEAGVPRLVEARDVIAKFHYHPSESSGGLGAVDRTSAPKPRRLVRERR